MTNVQMYYMSIERHLGGWSANSQWVDGQQTVNGWMVSKQSMVLPLETGVGVKGYFLFYCLSFLYCQIIIFKKDVLNG